MPAREDFSKSTHDKILDGAIQAISRHGLAKLAMRDVGASAGVARGTVYRHFASRDALLEELVQREAGRFLEQWREILQSAPAGEERLRVAFSYPARFAAEYPILLRLVESDPAYVLGTIRQYFPIIRATVQQLVGPVLAENPFVKDGVVPESQLVDWFVRLMLSAFLFPSEDPEALGQDLSAVYRALRDEPPKSA